MTDPSGIPIEQLAIAVQRAVDHVVVGDYTLRAPGFVGTADQAHLQVDVEHSSGVVVQTFILDIEEDH